MSEFVSHNLTTGEWNDSLSGDYLWTNQLTGEVYPTVMTPSTWSVWRILWDKVRIGDLPSVGNIGGRAYINVSVLYSFLKAFGGHRRAVEYMEAVVCRLPAGLAIPVAPISMKTFLQALPNQFNTELAKARLKKSLAEILATTPERCRRLRGQIRKAQKKAGLVALWREELEPLFSDLLALQDAANEGTFMPYAALKKELARLCGEVDASTLLSLAGEGSEQLASLAPLVGLSKVARGEMARAEYEAQFGYRGAHENELSIPRPAEDPAWLDRQLEDFEKSPVDTQALLEKRRAEFKAAWGRFQERYPRQVRAIKRRMDLVAQGTRTREAVRAELTRTVGVIRALFLRAAELTGLGDGVFFLSRQELIAVLSGDGSPVAYIPARREMHARYSALPSYPAFIRGHFDPFQWAADPNRRSDIFDSHAPVPASRPGTVKGYAGAAGRAEGIVRRINSPEEGDQLKPGEILLAVTTNIGWTPLFPRAAAVITDVGSPLSHAAIVAREMGIPAIVGCGNATMRLKTGDRVRVDGGQGIVEILGTGS